MQHLAARRGGGRALPAPVRRRMEDGFGADFGTVRIHTDPEAAELSAGIHARAFTVGHEVYFGKGAYHPESSSGRHLLAHELAHVVQQAEPDALSRSTGATRSPAPGAEHLGLQRFVHGATTVESNQLSVDSLRRQFQPATGRAAPAEPSDRIGASPPGVIQRKWFRMSTVLDSQDEQEVTAIGDAARSGDLSQAFRYVIHKHPRA